MDLKKLIKTINKNNLRKLDKFGYLDQIIDLKETDICIDEYIIAQEFQKIVKQIVHSLKQELEPDDDLKEVKIFPVK